MQDETIAALERAARRCDEAAQKYERWISFDSPPPIWADAYKTSMKEVYADAALIHALIETLRNGGERTEAGGAVRAGQGPLVAG